MQNSEFRKLRWTWMFGAYMASALLWVHGAETDNIVKELKGKKVAVTVFAQNDSTKPFEKTAQTRLESILVDNGVTVLDEKEAAKLKDPQTRLKDPGYILTAEEFVQISRKYEIQALARVYVNADVALGLADYYSATAQTDVRFVKSDAKVSADISVPMGVPKNPPSDGLTKDSAMINAIQRSLDGVCTRLGLLVSDPMQARAMGVKLTGPVPVPSGIHAQRKPEKDVLLGKFAKLERATWRTEDINCTTRAPGNSLAAVAGYVVDTDFHRRPPRLYGSRVHLIDLTTNSEINYFWCYEVEKKGKTEKASREILDCMFISNWRYLSALTGNEVFLWDTERGALLSRTPLDHPPKAASLEFARVENSSYLVVCSQRQPTIAYRIERRNQ